MSFLLGAVTQAKACGYRRVIETKTPRSTISKEFNKIQ